MTWEAWCRLVAALEAKAELAKQNGLPATAKSWRSTIENLRPAISFSARALHKSITKAVTKHRFYGSALSPIADGTPSDGSPW